MSDMTNEPTAQGPDDVTPVASEVAATEPIPATPAAPYVVSDAGVTPEESPATAASASEAPSRSDHVSISKRWLYVAGGVVLAVVLLGGTFASGVAVGHKTGRAGGRGAMMPGQFDGRGGYGMPGAPGQFDGPGRSGGQGGGQGGGRGYHNWGGNGDDRGLQQNSTPGQRGTLPAPNAPQGQSTTPTQ